MNCEPTRFLNQKIGMWEFQRVVLVLSSNVKHALHCILFITFLMTFEIFTGGFASGDAKYPDPFETYGYLPACSLYLLRLSTVLALPQCLCNCLGILFYNAFPDKVQLKEWPPLAPFMSFRLVTRGDYPDLVRDNVKRNMETCLETGLENFLFEVVTDRALDLPIHPRIREIVVPPAYRTRTGALYKARALQFCLEEDVNVLTDSDWIVHLDEETIVTRNSLKGILNFVSDGRHHFGQGVITYANESVVNWITTLADNFRVAEDLGRLRFQFKAFHAPLFGWKGSFIVSRAGAERKVSFDHGWMGSISEDYYFCMAAHRAGFTFDFVEGDMWEKSPFTLRDFWQQRRRWAQGSFLAMLSPSIPFRSRVFLACSWSAIPLSASNIILAALYPLPGWQIMNFLASFIGATTIYMNVFGAVQSFSLQRLGLLKYCAILAATLFMIPINFAVEFTAMVCGCLATKTIFYVVQKDVKYKAKRKPCRRVNGTNSKVNKNFHDC